MEVDFLKLFKDGLRVKVDRYAFDYLKEYGLGFIVESTENSIYYVDFLYSEEKHQILYIFLDDKIRKLIIKLDENNFYKMNSISYRVKNIEKVQLIEKAGYNTKLIIKFTNGETITLKSTNVFENWKKHASETLKEIYKKYY